MRGAAAASAATAAATAFAAACRCWRYRFRLSNAGSTLSAGGFFVSALTSGTMANPATIAMAPATIEDPANPKTMLSTGKPTP